MPTANNLTRIPCKAYAAYSESDGPRFGSLTMNAGYVTRANTEGQIVDGVIEGESFAQGGPVNLVTQGGPVEVVAGAAVSAGAEVMSDNAGKAITATSSNHRAGVARTAATQAGQIVEVDLVRQGTKA